MYLSCQVYTYNAHRTCRYHWLRLYIKNRQKGVTRIALEFAIQFCSPEYAYPIFEDLYNWLEMRLFAIASYFYHKAKMLYETQKKVKSIL